MRYTRTECTGALTKGALLEVGQVLFYVFLARSSEEYGVSILALEHAVVHHPAECNLGEGQTVSGRYDLDLRQCGEMRFVPITPTVSLRE